MLQSRYVKSFFAKTVEFFAAVCYNIIKTDMEKEKMIVLTKDNFNSEVENHKGLIIIDLYADWCGPCKMLAPILAELEGEYTDVKFCKVNVDNEPELASMFKVTSIPMIAAVKDNTFLDMSVGYVPKASLKKLIDENR